MVYYVKEHRASSKKSEGSFFIRKRASSNGVSGSSYQVRYLSFTKTFYEEHLAIEYLNKLINNDLSIITIDDVITKVEFDKFKRYIVVFTRGLESNEDLYFTEKVESKEVSEAQYNNFISSCFVQWKLVFGKFNTDYRNKLYKRKLLGFQNVH